MLRPKKLDRSIPGLINRKELDADSRAADQAMVRIQTAIDSETLSLYQRWLNKLGMWLTRSSLPR